MAIRNEIGRRHGKYYKLIYDKRKNQQACDKRYANEKRWFLWIGGNTEDFYVGDFATKTKAYHFINNDEADLCGRLAKGDPPEV